MWPFNKNKNEKPCCHDWKYFVMSIKFQKAFPYSGKIGRECCVCAKLEYLDDDKKTWNDGCRGVIETLPR